MRGKRWDGHTEKDVTRLLSLEQKPCEDAISRQAVIDGINQYFHDEYYQRTSIQDCRDCLIEDVIKDISPINPQLKTGHWIGIDEEPHEVWECDHCGFVIDGSGCIDPYDYRDTYKYCPYCGARMVDEQESEVQNADSN